MPHTLTPGDGQDLLARFKDAWQKRDPEAMLELYADDAEYRTDPFVEPLAGVNAIREHWNAIAAEQLHIDFDAEHMWVVGRTVLASWHVAFTRDATAERVRVRGFSTLGLDGSGRIARMRDWTVMRVVGTDSSHQPDGTHEQSGE